MRRVLGLLALVAAATASAQFNSSPRRSAFLGNTQVVTKDGSKVSTADLLAKDQFVDVETGAPVNQFSYIRDNQKIKSVKTGEVFSVRVPERYLTVGVYGVSFGIAGPIQQSDGSFAGGTANANNPLLSLDLGLPMPQRFGTLGLGGWYFFSPSGTVDDVYQIHLRYGLKNNSPWGFQVAYLEARHPDTNGLTFHANYTLSSTRFDPKSKPWSVEFGAGGYNSRGRQPLENGGFEKRSTLDPSFYVNGSWTVLPKVTAVATFWSLRERNQDLTRLGLGLAYRF